jgi:hypothetical protein
MIYIIESKNKSTVYERNFNSLEETKHWIINHLDLSLEWTIRLKNA